MKDNLSNSSLLIIGAGGHSSVVFEIAEASGNFVKINFLDDCFGTFDINNKKFKDKIIGKIDNLYSKTIKNEYKYAFIAIGDNKIRFELLNNLVMAGYKIPVLCHQTAHIAENALINCGTLISANCVVQSFCEIGNGVIINTASTVDHDSKIGDCVHICPGVNIAGEVEIGKFSFIGIGSLVIQGVKIGDNVLISAGAKVLKNINSNVKFIDK